MSNSGALLKLLSFSTIIERSHIHTHVEQFRYIIHERYLTRLILKLEFGCYTLSDEPLGNFSALLKIWSVNLRVFVPLSLKGQKDRRTDRPTKYLIGLIVCQTLFPVAVQASSWPSAWSMIEWPPSLAVLPHHYYSCLDPIRSDLRMLLSSLVAEEVFFFSFPDCFLPLTPPLLWWMFRLFFASSTQKVSSLNV